jgi:hypothetical protein
MTNNLSEAYLRSTFYPGLVTKAEYNDSNGRVTSYSCIIKSYLSGYLEVTIKDGENIAQLQPGTHFFLLSFNSKENTVNYFKFRIQDLLTGKAASTLKLSEPEKTEIRSLRCFFRCEVSLAFVYIDESFSTSEGKIKNLSASGMLGVIKASATLKLNDLIVTQFELPSDPDQLRLIARIVRIINLPKNLQEIALHFTQIPEAEQNQIIKYLFVRQRESRNGIKGLHY